MNLALVLAGAAIGAPARYLIDRAIQRWRGSPFPWGTLTVNVLGCFVLGIVAEATVDSHLTALLGTGFCGGFTTYSTFAYETAGLSRIGAWLPALLNIVASVVCGIAAVVLGVVIGGQLGGS